MKYHPNPYEPSSSNKAYRNVDKRLQLMMKNYDFTAKNVLDLGCSGGYFCFKLSEASNSVKGVDADSELILRNSEIVKKHQINNLEFQHSIITPKFINQQKPVDIVLFLSVLHHIITDSKVYDCNNDGRSSLRYAVEILRAINSKAKHVYFEIGQSNESYHWAKLLPDMGKKPANWIVENLIKPAGFSGIKIIDQLEGSFLKKKMMHSKINLLVNQNGLCSKAVRKLLSYDDRDSRSLFLLTSGDHEKTGSPS